MTFNAGAPQSVTLRIPREYTAGYFPELGLYLQDRWTFKRATVTGGLRYDYFLGTVGDGTLPSSRWNPEQFFPGFELQHWKDLSPRVGVAFDVFGNGRTAVKVSGARYVEPLATETQLANNPQTTIGATDTRTWRDLNGDYTIYNPDGSLQSDELGPDEQRQLRQAHSVHQHPGPAHAQRLELPGRHRRMADRRAAPGHAASWR